MSPDPSSPDTALVTRIRAGDELAFQQLFESYFEPLAQFAYRATHSAATAEDIVHDVLLSVWQRRTTWAPTASIRQYLFGAVHHLVLRQRAHDAREQRYQARIHHEATVASYSPANMEVDHAELIVSELAAAYERTLAAMPERMRLVYTLSREQQLTYAEIAHTLTISIKTVETQMGRALAKLREALSPYM